MKLTFEEYKLLYNYLAKQWIHYDEVELRALVSRIGKYIEITEIVNNEIRADIINDSE